MDNEEIIVLDDELNEDEIIINENDEDEITISEDKVVNIGTRNYEELENKPQINGVDLIKNRTLDDLGIENDKTYLHTQNETSDEWHITHNLDKYPSVTVMNSAGDEVIGDVNYISKNQLVITFKGAFKGNATLN